MKIETINPIIVRDEGVYKTKIELKEKILAAYKKLTKKIIDDIKKNKIRGLKFFFRGSFSKWKK